jgi:hypothetical protein
MKSRISLLSVLCVCVGLLIACGEKPQDKVSGKAGDEPSYAGTGKGYMQPGWKPGDKTSWESHLRARGQQGMNEYNKTQAR